MPWSLLLKGVIWLVKRLLGQPDPNAVGKQLEAGKEAQDALKNVAQAQHIQNDVDVGGPLGDWVRERAKRGD